MAFEAAIGKDRQNVVPIADFVFLGLARQAKAMKQASARTDGFVLERTRMIAANR